MSKLIITKLGFNPYDLTEEDAAIFASRPTLPFASAAELTADDAIMAGLAEAGEEEFMFLIEWVDGVEDTIVVVADSEYTAALMLVSAVEAEWPDAAGVPFNSRGPVRR